MTALPDLAVRGRAARRTAAVGALTGHAVRAFARNPVGAFFTLVFPLAFLVIVSSIVGGATTGADVPVTQFLVAPFAVFGVAQASFVLVAVDMAGLRESGVLLRFRSAPVPAWAVLASRIAAAMVSAGTAVALLTTVGALGYGVQIVWRKTPAMVLTLLIGIACCAALGLALSSLTRTVAAAQSLAQAVLVMLAFVSEVFIVGATLPRWLDALGTVFPLKHFALAMAETFDTSPGYGFSPGHLAVLTVWGAAGMVVARLRFGWQPRGAARPPAAADAARVYRRELSPPVSQRRSWTAVLSAQTGHALLGLRRDALAVFFALVFPAALLALFPAVFGHGLTHGMPMEQYLFAGMVAYTAALTGYVDMPESVVGARSAGVLKRLRGTPLPFRWYYAGRTAAALLISLFAALLLALVGTAFLGVRLDPARVPALLLAIVVGSLCFSAIGLALVALLPSARSIVAITLGTLLPLCFASEIFVVGDTPLPGWLTTAADVFPLRHLLHAVLAATDPAAGGSGVALGHLAVLIVWTAFALLVAGRHRDAPT
ncbi:MULTISPECIES: ABC transporter permease [Catenuloplanes]|uniref:Transport permease protein n=1 Tax=Catenuloplanes niger TaxID=587534 RepID=A0AAE4CVQ8_9ACTN|nr:ABC transporter permease [Catenuloplanes niger]MDR7327656.1 ABC-type multidrug transport system permease subunit [Catenuloplanes niger]